MKKFNMTFILLIVIAFLVLLLGFFLILNGSKQKKVFKTEENIIENNKFYNVKISYPIFNVDNIDTDIKKYVDNLYSDFIKRVEETKKTDKEFEYELNIQYSMNDYKDTRFVHLTSFIYTGGNHHVRNDKNISYDLNSKNILQLKDFFKKEYFNELSNLSYLYVIDTFHKKNISYDSELIKIGVSSKDSFDNYTFTNQGLQLKFPPYQVASWSVNEVVITIPYNDIKGIVDEKFISAENDKKLDIKEVKKRDLSMFKDKKLLALTFDDGPGIYTNNLINELNSRNAKATFFVLGTRSNQWRDTIYKAYIEGHQIGTHTFSHKNLTILNNDMVKNEIKSATDIILEITGSNPTVLRPPYGNTNLNIRKLSNLNTILWNVDTLDWKHRNSDLVYNEIMKDAKDGNIILLHDIYETSVIAAIKAVDALKEQGYEFVTIDEMCEIKGITLDFNKAYSRLY